VNVVGELQRKRTLAASRGFLAAARLSCLSISQRVTSYPSYTDIILTLLCSLIVNLMRFVIILIKLLCRPICMYVHFE